MPNISSGTLILTGPDDDVADVYNYEVALANNSWGRVSDGSPSSSWFSTPTPRVSNTLLIIPPAPLIINELMSSNLLDTIDESGIHEDWFEIVNTSEYNVDLAGYYVTDRLNNPMKYQFPLGIPDSTVIEPGGGTSTRVIPTEDPTTTQIDESVNKRGARVVEQEYNIARKKYDTVLKKSFNPPPSLQF